jgi:hypothetical protein
LGSLLLNPLVRQRGKGLGVHRLKAKVQKTAAFSIGGFERSFLGPEIMHTAFFLEINEEICLVAVKADAHAAPHGAAFGPGSEAIHKCLKAGDGGRKMGGPDASILFLWVGLLLPV